MFVFPGNRMFTVEFLKNRGITCSVILNRSRPLPVSYGTSEKEVALYCKVVEAVTTAFCEMVNQMVEDCGCDESCANFQAGAENVKA